MKNRLLTLLAVSASFLFINGCSSSGGAQSSTFEVEDSLFSFKYDKQIPEGQVAKLGEDPVTNKQLVDNAPALVGLHNRRDEIWMAMAYRWVNENMTEGAESISVEFNFEKPERKFDAILSEHQFAKNKKIKVSFAEEPQSGMGIAKADDQWIQKDQIPLSYLGYFQNEDKIFKEKVRQLNRIYKTRALFHMAKAANQAVADYVRKNILTEEVEVSDQMVSEFLAQRKIAESDLNDRVKEQFRDIVAGKIRNEKTDKFLEKTVKDKLVHVNFRPNVDRLTLKTKDGLGFGDEKAPVEIRWFGGFYCQQCSQSLALLESLFSKYKNKVRFVSQFAFPSNSRYERVLAEATACVHEQDPSETISFVKYARELHPPVKDEDLSAVVQKVKGIGLDAYTKCFLARTHKDVVGASVDGARYLGILEPGLFAIDGYVFQPDDPIKRIEKTLNRQIAAAAPSGILGWWHKIVATVKTWFSA